MLLWGYIDHRGLFVIEPRFEWAQPFDGLLAMVKENGVIGYINRHGETVWREETPTGSDTLMPYMGN